MARPARAVTATILTCGNGADPSPSRAAVPLQPNIFRFAGVSATFTSIPPPLPLLQLALLQRLRHHLLDHAVTEMTLQLAQPQEIRQPPVR